MKSFEWWTNKIEIEEARNQARQMGIFWSFWSISLNYFALTAHDYFVNVTRMIDLSDVPPNSAL